MRLVLAICVAATAAVLSSRGWAAGAQAVAVQQAGASLSAGNPLPAAALPSSAAAIAIVPVVSTAAEASHVLKAAAGNLYSLYVTSGTVAGYLMTFNATAAPANGAVTPIDCVAVPANSTVSLFNGVGPPDYYAAGITAVFSSTGCFSQTASATAFFKARVQ
jgi:hypothetical protein